MGRKKKTLVIKSIYQITIYLFIWQNLYLYIFAFCYYKNKSLTLSDTVSLKNENAKYTAQQQQQLQSTTIHIQTSNASEVLLWTHSIVFFKLSFSDFNSSNWDFRTLNSETALESHSTEKLKKKMVKMSTVKLRAVDRSIQK